ncbi:TetR/AcrR family transcriptional regulator [Rhizobium sophorae]|uniref:TetR/AcrR family transcriptional regulator n=1 Tax=Rhizobium sophorae TaxID=1535242 RepID=A0A7Y3S223_9HYPH|nr:TetR/AcrR family transcriptional regulator [Rhizobium sophorae]MBX4864216.1 TetR/AcrR family transcriptional regulator [Rhizobium bangladeshense]NNU35604.1 TetR/AcrR family transcriptional regulator [Rhizobium sophorae]
MTETVDRLLDLAEARMCDAGYRGFSFRGLAAEIGIKSASVHHHFPTKAGMAAAVARRYGERFFELVGRRPRETADEVIAVYRSIFRSEIERDGRMCLNGMLGAEAGGLPAEVLEEIETYFRRCIDDLSSRIGGPNAAERAFHIMAALEGGLILARAYGDISVFDHATASLTTPALAAA